MARSSRRRRRTGFTLLETILALAIAGVATTAAIYAIQKRATEIRAEVAGKQFHAVQDAARDYLRDNFSAVHAELRSTNPLLLDPDGDGESVDDLVDAGYLAQGWASAGPLRSPYGHGYQVWVRDPVPSDQNVGFEALVVSLGTQDPGPTLNARAALSAGETSGFVNHLDDPQTIQGLYGGWTLDVTSFRPAGASALDVHVASLLPIATETDCGRDFYRLEIPGCEDSSTAEAPIVFANNLDASGSVNPDAALGLEVTNRAVFGSLNDSDEDGLRLDGMLIVNSYLELSPERQTVSGSVTLPAATTGNVFHYRVNNGATFTLPAYVPAQTAAGVVDTANSVTIVLEIGSGITDADNEIRFNAAGGSIDWGYGDDADDPDHCTGVNDTMVFQFLRFAGRSMWTGQLVWQSCP